MFGVLLAFTTAVIESGKDIYLSSAPTRGVMPLLRAFFLPLLSLPLVFIVAFVQGWPVIQHTFWIYVGAHALLMVAANYCYMQALAKGAVSETQPMLALTTVFLIITTPLLTNDVVTVLGWVGVVLVGVGVYATQHPGRDPVTGIFPPLWVTFFRMWRVPGVSWMFVTAIIYSITSNLDKLAVLSSNGPTYLMFDYLFTALLTAILIGVLTSLKIFPSIVWADLSPTAKRIAPGSALSALATLVQMWALTLLPVPYVIALKRLSIVFTSFWGYFVRHERAPHWYRILGALIVFAGLALILIFGKI